MLKRIGIAAIVLFALVSVSIAGSKPDIKEGKWEITSKVEMPGMPVQIPAVKHTQCLTKENSVPDSSQQNGKCTITESKVSGNTVTWVLECDNKGGGLTGKGKIVYQKITFEGTVEIEMPQENMKMTTHLSGKYIGACD